MEGVRQEIVSYVEERILPQYEGFDAAHRYGHANKVIQNSMVLAQHFDVDSEMVYTIAAYHDIGLRNGRENHEQASAAYLLADEKLAAWFTTAQRGVMAEAVADHRASNATPPRSLYGRIVAEADRDIDYMTILTRTLQYSLANYPEFYKEQHFERCYAHLQEKYGENGYMKLWLDVGGNKRKLDEMRRSMKTPAEARKDFDAIYISLTGE